MHLLLAEELALIAIDPGRGRAAIGTKDNLNACLAGLLLAELHLDDRPQSSVLDAAQQVVDDAGPKPKAVLSAMDRGLRRRRGNGTWDTLVGSLHERGIVAPEGGKGRPRTRILDLRQRDAIVDRLRHAAATDEPIDPRTAAVLSMTGPAQLLELVAPDRSTRRHARGRIDHALDDTTLEPIGAAVRRVIADAAAAVAAGSTAAAVVATS